MLRLREASGAGMDPSPDPSAWEDLRVTFNLFLVLRYDPQAGLVDATVVTSHVK